MARNQILVRWEPKDFDDVSQADLIRVSLACGAAMVVALAQKSSYMKITNSR